MPIATAVRRPVSPVRSLAISRVSTAANSTSRLSLLTEGAMWVNSGIASGTNAAAIGTGSGNDSRRAVAHSSRGTAAVSNAVHRRRIR